MLTSLVILALLPKMSTTLTVILPPNANHQPPGPPTSSTGPDPPRSVYGMLGSGPPQSLTGPAWANQRPLPFQPPARERPPKLRPTPTGLQSPISGLRSQDRDQRSEIRCVEDESSPVSGLWSPISALRQSRPMANVSRRGRQRHLRAQFTGSIQRENQQPGPPISHNTALLRRSPLGL